MEIKKIKRKIVSKLDKQNNQYEINSNEMISKLKDIDALLDEAELGGGTHHHERLAKKGKCRYVNEYLMFLIPILLFGDQPTRCL